MLLLGLVVLSLRVHLLNDLLHELTGLAQLLELLLEFEVEAAEGDNLVGGGHALDTCEQVVRHVVRRLENVVLFAVSLRVVRVRYFID